MPAASGIETLAKRIMKKIFVLLIALMLVVSMTACDSAAKNDNPPSGTDVNTPATDKPADNNSTEPPSGIQDDGMGEDPSYGEGIGEVIALSEDEKAYVIAQTTNTWLELSPIEKDDLVVLIGRWLEDSSGFIVESYDDLIAMLDHQMEQYFKNGVDEGVLATVCDICGAAMPADAPTKPSGIQDDGMGEDPSYGEGIGEVIALSEDEKAYVIAQTTNTWLELSPIEKDDLVVLIGRWLEDSSGFIVESYEDLVAMLDHQMEQYFKNGVDEGVLATVCDICGVEFPG